MAATRGGTAEQHTCTCAVLSYCQTAAPIYQDETWGFVGAKKVYCVSEQ